MKTVKVACLRATMTQVQGDLGDYGLIDNVDAFWAQFTQWYNKVAKSLRDNTKNEGRVVKKKDDMDPTSQQLYKEMLAWLREVKDV